MGAVKPKAEFLTPLRLEDVDGEHFLLLEPLKFYSAELGKVVVVPAGMLTDFASIPRGLWNILPKTGKHDRAAVVHDGGYRGYLLDTNGRALAFTRGQVDRLFLEGMEASGVGRVARRLMYWGVRVGGHWAWKGEPPEVAA